MAKNGDVGEGAGLSDEEWAEFERSFTKESAKSATYKEPSARQRELTAKWKREAPTDTGWRTDGPPTSLTSVPGRPGSGAGNVYDFAAARKKRRRWFPRSGVLRSVAVILLAAIAVGLLIELPNLFRGGSTDSGTKTNGQTAYVTPQAAGQGSSGAPAATSPATTAPTTQAADVFAGSPAVGYAVGADGIVIPAAAGLGRYSARQVTDAMAQTKQYLVATNLDPQVLMGGRPDAAMALVDPLEEIHSWFDGALQHPDFKDDPTSIVTRFLKTETKLATPTVKVHGSMAPALDSDGSLLIKTDYLFVYGVTAADGTGTPVRETVRRVVTTKFADPNHFRVTPGKIWLQDYTDQVDNSPCGIYDGYLHPFYPDATQAQATTPSVTPTAPGTGATSPTPTAVESFDPFDQSKPLAGDSTKFACTSAIRT